MLCGRAAFERDQDVAGLDLLVVASCSSSYTFFISASLTVMPFSIFCSCAVRDEVLAHQRELGEDVGILVQAGFVPSDASIFMRR